MSGNTEFYKYVTIQCGMLILHYFDVEKNNSGLNFIKLMSTVLPFFLVCTHLSKA